MKHRLLLMFAAFVVIAIVIYAGLFIGYQQSLQSSNVRAATVAAQMEATALATLSR